MSRKQKPLSRLEEARRQLGQLFIADLTKALQGDIELQKALRELAERKAATKPH